MSNLTYKPTQLLTATMLCVPFLRFNDPNRLQMASNHLRQSLPLINAEIPRIRTGFENVIIKKAESFYIETNTFEKIDEFIVKTDEGLKFNAMFLKYDEKLKVAYNPYHICFVRDIVSGGWCPELKLGVNALVGYMSYYGFNYQDAVVISESFAKRLKHIERKVFVIRLPANSQLKHISSTDNTISLIPIPGKVYNTLISYEYIEAGVLQRKQINVDNLLVVDVRVKALPNYRLPASITEFIKKAKKPFKLAKLETEPTQKYPIVIQIVGYVTREATIGDKLTNRHGNKGVIGLIVPDEEMPKTKDGKVLDILFSPLSVPSRMNLGQLMENLLAKIVVKVEQQVLDLLNRNKRDKAQKLLLDFLKRVEKRSSFHHLIDNVITKRWDLLEYNLTKYGLSIIQPPFSELNAEEIKQLAKDYNVKETEYVRVDNYDVTINVGYQTILKLEHLASSKVTGAGLTNNEYTNPQRIGEMETWNIIAHDYDEIKRLFRRSYEFEKLSYYSDKFGFDSYIFKPDVNNVYQVYKKVLFNE
ncbi:MAG: hypothetical protein JHC31_00090 [Sulfurihydrogenibium sp.]|nr:hypothetical protein [Sulfurihydrogenibium sp.]